MQIFKKQLGTVSLNKEQRSILLSWLDLQLRNERLVQSYAKELNDLYVQLTGHDHPTWDKLYGYYL